MTKHFTWFCLLGIMLAMGKDTAIVAHPVDSNQARVKRATQARGGGNSLAILKEWFDLAGTKPGWKSLSVHHMRSDKSAGDQIYATNIPGDNLDSLAVEQIAERIVRVCKLDAQSHSQPQQYVIYPRDKDGDIGSGRCIIRESGAHSLDSNEPLDTEAPTLAGITSQLMRHTESHFKSANLVVMANVKLLVEQNQTLLDRINTLEAERDKNARVREKLLDRQQERDLVNKAHDHKMENWRDVAGVAKMLLPTIVNKLSGKKILPEKFGSRDLMVKALIESILADGPRQEKLFGILKPHELGTLMELIQSFPDAAEEIAKDEKAAAETAEPEPESEQA